MWKSKVLNMKIIIADADRDFCQMVEEQLRSIMPAASLESVYEGNTLVRRVAETCPNLVLLNLLLPERDGLSAMAVIRAMELPFQPELMVFSGYLTPRMQEELCQLRPAFFTALPCDLQMLAQRAMLCCREMLCRSPRKQEDSQGEQNRLLREMGLTMHCKGFSYARYGLQLLLEDPTRDLCVTKWIYPAIAQRFNTTAANVERAIRSAIVAAWQRKGYLLQWELFRERPTNSEFLAVLAERLRQTQQMAGTR